MIALEYGTVRLSMRSPTGHSQTLDLFDSHVIPTATNVISLQKLSTSHRINIVADKMTIIKHEMLIEPDTGRRSRTISVPMSSDGTFLLNLQPTIAKIARMARRITRQQWREDQEEQEIEEERLAKEDREMEEKRSKTRGPQQELQETYEERIAQESATAIRCSVRSMEAAEILA
jgi:hypothetical protein